MDSAQRRKTELAGRPLIVPNDQPLTIASWLSVKGTQTFSPFLYIAGHVGTLSATSFHAPHLPTQLERRELSTYVACHMSGFSSTSLSRLPLLHLTKLSERRYPEIWEVSASP